jgi:Cupredoxin-like domain
MKLIAFIFLCFISAHSLAKETFYKIVLENHRFSPAKTTVPAGKKVKLLVINKDASIDEFHSDDLGVEKIISGNSKAMIFVGPLKPGRYSFMGEFNAKTAQGLIIAK